MSQAEWQSYHSLRPLQSALSLQLQRRIPDFNFFNALLVRTNSLFDAMSRFTKNALARHEKMSRNVFPASKPSL